MPTSGFGLSISGRFFLYVDRGSVRPGRQFPAAPPYNKDDVYVAEGHEESRDDKDIRGQEGKVELALPPCSVAFTGTLVLDHALRINANGNLHSNWIFNTPAVLIMLLDETNAVPSRR